MKSRLEYLSTFETSMRGGRPATTTSRPIHILLIFPSEPRNPHPLLTRHF